MQYIKKDMGSYNLHIIPTKKYKTITMKVLFHSPIIKEEITMRNILSDILLQSTKKYSSKREMIIESENLYAVDIYNNTQRWGNYVLTSFILQGLKDEYTEEGNFEKAIEFLSEILFNPDVTSNAFQNEKLELVKNNCEVTMKSIKEDPQGYANIRLKEAYDKTGPISYRMIGYQEDLERVNNKNLYQYYKKMIENDFVDIFIVGDVEVENCISMIKKYFKFRKVKKKKISYEVKPKITRKKLIAKEQNQTTQSRLAIACSIGTLKEQEKNYALVLANIILGGGIDSKLFQKVREKYSLCYTIYSTVSKLDNTLVIQAGIDRESYEKTTELITKILESMKKGSFSVKDIKTAKEYYASSIKTIEENPMNVIREIQTEEILGIEPYEERMKKIEKITKKQIIKVLKKIKIDTVYLLEGDKS